MGANERANRDKTMAAHLKKAGVMRRTGSCPWGCGASIANGGPGLLAHLTTCRGGQH